jgi:hypothetical protein
VERRGFEPLTSAVQAPPLRGSSATARAGLSPKPVPAPAECDRSARRSATAAWRRVETWRGGVRSSMSVSAPFVWRCLSGSTVAPFPRPAHRTGQADFPHPALGQDLSRLSRATPSAASEHHLELISCPISMSFATSRVCLELRPLPSAGVTRFPGTTDLSATPQRLACPSRASSWSCHP